MYSILIVRSEKRFDRGCSGQSDVGETLLSVERRRRRRRRRRRGRDVVVVVLTRREAAGRTDWARLDLAFPRRVTGRLQSWLSCCSHRLERGEDRLCGSGHTEMSLTVAWTVLSGAATFLLTNLLAGLLVPAAASRNQQQRWKWRNVATSLVHSVITGLWALAAFYEVKFDSWTLRDLTFCVSSVRHRT